MQTDDQLSERMREALRCFARAVAIITCRDGDAKFAMAATAFTEVSVDPPSLLVCVNRSASLYQPLAKGADFCVNLLHDSHEPVSRACGGGEKGDDRFRFGDWALDDAGPPFLRDAQANFFCRMEKTIDFDTHGIFIGRVFEMFVRSEISPLLYSDRRYANLQFPVRPPL